MSFKHHVLWYLPNTVLSNILIEDVDNRVLKYHEMVLVTLGHDLLMLISADSISFLYERTPKRPPEITQLCLSH